MDEIINKKGIFWIKDESNSFEGKITIRDGYFYLDVIMRFLKNCILSILKV